MTYDVRVAQSFVDDVDALFTYWQEQFVGEQTSASWLNRLFELVDDLSTMPERGELDAAQSAVLERETRRVQIGEYLVFYQIDVPSRVVNVLRLIHGAQRA